jgi:hypothetical protein
VVPYSRARARAANPVSAAGAADKDHWADDDDAFEAIVDAAAAAVEAWEPVTGYHFEVVRQGRVLDWLVWRTVSDADEATRAVFHDLEMPEPWAIALDTLPPYGRIPTALTGGG